MKSIATTLFAYGTFLILVGLIGYLSNPEKAKTALISGGTFGALNFLLGWLALREWRPTVVVSMGIAGFLGVVFTWRATVSWMTFAQGQSEKLTAAILITAMLSATIGLLVYLLRNRRTATMASA